MKKIHVFFMAVITVLMLQAGCGKNNPAGPAPVNTVPATLTATITPPANTATATPVETATDTPADTATMTATGTDTPEDTATATDTPVDTETATETCTDTPEDTATGTMTLTSTPEDTFTPTETFTDSPTETASESHTETYTLTETPTESHTLTATLTWTASDTSTDTPTFTETNTFTGSPTMTDTPLPTDTATPTFTASGTATATATNTPLAWGNLNTIYNGNGNWPCNSTGTNGFTDASWYPHSGANFTTQYVAGELGKKWIAGNYAAIASYSASYYGEALLLNWNGSAWDTVASVSGSGVYGGQTSVFQDPYNGDIYYAYTADSGDQKLHVKKYSGGSWTDLNHHTSGTGKAYKNSAPGWVAIAGYNNGSGAMIYVAYVDWNANSKVAVSNHDGFGWNTLWGGGYASTNAGSYVDLVADGASYNVYLTYTEGGRTYVKRSAGGVWATMGALNPVSDVNGSNNTLYAVSSSEVYVAYTDSLQSGKATVKKFDGSAWSVLGAAGFTPQAVTYNGLYKSGANLMLIYKGADNKIYEMSY